MQLNGKQIKDGTIELNKINTSTNQSIELQGNSVFRQNQLPLVDIDLVNKKYVDDLFKIEYWTIELMDSYDIIFYADKNMTFDSIINIKNSPTITINVNGTAYTLGDSITIGDEIEVISNIASVIKIKATII